MGVRCKFFVQSITRQRGWGGAKECNNIKLQVVGDGSAENKAFYASTPGGSMEFISVKAEVTDQFAIGQEFYVDLTPA